MENLSVDNSYGLNKIIWPAINEFQRILNKISDNPLWIESRDYKNLNAFIPALLKNDIINNSSNNYLDFFKKTTNREFDEIESQKIKFGFVYSLLTHMDDPRIVGGHYFNHINSIAIELAKNGWDVETIIGGFVHDTIETKVKSIEEKKINLENKREFFISDYIRSRKSFFDFNEQNENNKKTEKIIDDIINDYERQTNIKIKEKELNQIKNGFKNELEYGIKRLITRLSKSKSSSYERYDSDIFKFENYEQLTKKGKRLHETKKNSIRVDKKHNGFSKFVKEKLEDIIISNVNRGIAVKIEDRINNIQTLNVVNYDLEEIVNTKKGFTKLIYKGISSLSKLKRNFVEYTKITEEEMKEYTLQNKKIGFFRNLIRKAGHELNKRHFTSSIIAEQNYLKAWKDYIKNVVKGKTESKIPIYKSLKHEKKINEYWKNIILIDRLNNYLDNYKNQESIDYKRLKERSDILREVTINEIEKDINHSIEWHLQPKEYQHWMNETETYFGAGGLKGKTPVNLESELDGLTYVLNLKIDKVSDEKISNEKAVKISKKLEVNRGYQFAALRSLKGILENYKEGKYLEGFIR
jgi:hypothetical protein